MSTLPPEMIVEILSKLPVKSLSRFKCVSEQWKFLISHPLFVKMHLSQTRTLGRTRLLGDGMNDLFSIDLETVSGKNDRISLLGLEFPERLLDDSDCIICMGSCNGLLCIVNESRELFVYNPSTKECKFIAYFDVNSGMAFLHGFGYAKSIDDYKIVKIVYQGNIVKVYSVRNDSWTSIQSDILFPEEYFNVDVVQEYINVGIALNGAVHWGFKDPQGLCVIAAFDLVEEKFKTLPPPNILQEGKRCRYFLGVLKGCLCFAMEKSGSGNQIWVMEEYGIKKSWIRIVTLTKISQLKPLCYLNNSETMLLFFCDPKERKLKKVKIGVFSNRDDATESHSLMHFGGECSFSWRVLFHPLIHPTSQLKLIR